MFTQNTPQSPTQQRDIAKEIGWKIGQAIVWLLKILFRFAILAPITALLVLLLVFRQRIILLAVFALFSALTAYPIIQKHNQKWPTLPTFLIACSFIGDFLRLKNYFQQARAYRKGKKFLDETGIVPADVSTPECLLFETPEKVTIKCSPLPHVSPETLKNTLTSHAFRFLEDPLLVPESEFLKSGECLITVNKQDPLDTDLTIKDLEKLELDPENASIVVGVDSSGEKVPLPYKNTSGCTISGSPGSGKSIFILSLAAKLATARAGEYVPDIPNEFKNDRLYEISILDGKFGAEFSVFHETNNCFDYFSGDKAQDLDAVISFFEKQLEDCQQRILDIAEKTQYKNYWNIPLRERIQNKWPAKIIFIDEAQQFLAPENYSSKEDKTKVQQIQACVASLIRRMRSAGCLVFVLSQKLDSQSCPSSISNNCSLKICFKVATSQNVITALGETPENPKFDPRNCRLAGTFIMKKETGEYVKARNFYLPENAITKILENTHKTNQHKTLGETP